MKFIRSLFLISLAVAPLTSAKEPVKKAQDWLVDTTLVYQQGSALSSRYLKKNIPEFSQHLNSAMPWVVRIEVQHGITPTGYSSNHGTGIILADGRVITAKHVLTKNVKDLAAKTKITLTTVDGRVFPASVLKKGKADWMVLKMKLKKGQNSMLKSPIKTAKPVKGETVVFLGYPARLGLDENGKVQSFHKGDSKNNIPVSKLKPMIIVGTVSDPNKMFIQPLAGFPPVGGMSGGPVFNLKGEVVAAQHSVTKTHSDATGEMLFFRVDATPNTVIKP